MTGPTDASRSRKLPAAEEAALLEHGWDRRVGNGPGLWVRVQSQELRLIARGRSLALYSCSTARNGIDGREGSGGTPDGWLEIRDKIGDGLPAGAVLSGRRFTGEICRRFDEGEDDLVLTRILRLTGLEPGRNLGGDVDTWRRLIYIHGTNAPGRLGTPVSHGCVRLGNEEIVDLFDRVGVGCRVLVTAR